MVLQQSRHKQPEQVAPLLPGLHRQRRAGCCQPPGGKKDPGSIGIIGQIQPLELQEKRKELQKILE